MQSTCKETPPSDGYLGGCFLFVVRLISWRHYAWLFSFAVL